MLNAEGQLIGINTAIYGGGAQGIGFAIPIDVAKRIVRELITKGEVVPVWLGLDLGDLDPQIRELLGLPKLLTGALLRRIRKGGPSHGSDLERGDVITHVDGSEVRSARELYELLERSTQGQAHLLRVQRAGTQEEIQVRPREIEADAVLMLADDLLGLELEPSQNHYRVTSVREGSGAQKVGFEAGDQILGLSGRRVGDPASLRRAVVELRGRGRALVVVRRAARQYNVNVPLAR